MIRAVLAVAVAVAVVAAVTVGAAPAVAHPFGPPPVARLSAEGTVVQVRWTAAPDDLLALGYGAGVLHERPAALDQAEGTPFGGGTDVTAAEAALLTGAPEVASYLGDGVQVRQDGIDCPGEVRDAADLVDAGALLAFTCPAPVRTVDVGVELLTDLHPAYRTMAVSAEGQRALYTTDDTVESWTFGGASGAGPTLAVGGVGALLAAVGAATVVRRRRRHGAAVTPA